MLDYAARLHIGHMERTRRARPYLPAEAPYCVRAASRGYGLGVASPFGLGVASGSPLPSSVVLWTRIAPEPLEGGGAGRDPIAVRWEFAPVLRICQHLPRSGHGSISRRIRRSPPEHVCMRVVFAVYLTLILGGIVLYTIIGLTHP